MSDAISVATRHRPRVDDVIAALSAAFRPEMDVPPAAGDLTIGQLRLMIMIGRSGPMSMHQVAESFRVSQTAATGLVERAERQGVVERRHRSDDRRVVECHVTEAGNQLLGELSGIRTQGLREALSGLSDAQLAELERLLRLIADRRSADRHVTTQDRAVNTQETE